MALELILRELRPFELSHFFFFFFFFFCIFFFFFFLHCMLWRLCNHFLLQFLMNASQTLQTYCEYIENMHVGFGLS